VEPAESPAGQPILNILGPKVALGPQRRDLLSLYQTWINDFEVGRSLGHGLRPVTLESEQVWFDTVNRGERDVVFTIYERASLRPIGNTGLHQIDHENGTAEFGIMIGEKSCWGRGYGTEATRLMLDYAFTALGLHNILLRVFSFNRRGLNAYRRAGFREIGRRREGIRRGQRYHDVIYMDCLAAEFESPLLERLLGPEPA
jgi:RimJ/RimL family protein N-acetyltransferase